MGEPVCTGPGREGDGDGRWKVSMDSRVSKAASTWNVYGLDAEIKSSPAGRCPVLGSQLDI